MSCGKVCEESAKKVAEGSDEGRKYVARVGLNWSLLSGSEASELKTARVILKMMIVFITFKSSLVPLLEGL